MSNFEHDTSNILPCDIMLSIFICLPIKILFRFQSVSKSWKAMICDRNFQRNHRDYYKALGQQKLLVRQQGYSTDFVFRDPENPQLVMMDDDKQFFPSKGFQYSQVYGSCDGLVLLKNPMGYKNYLLWNPSTRQSRILVCPYVKYKHDPPNACGYCYDSRMDDYKAVLIFRYFYVIYSSSTHYWTSKTSPPYLVQRYPPGYRAQAGVSTQDCIFWSMNNVIVDTTSTLMYFDVTSDEVKNIPASNLDFVGEEELFCLASLKGCLSLYGGNTRHDELQVWIMEQDGWKLLLNICNLPTICSLFVPQRQLLHLTKNGQPIFEGGLRGVEMYDPKQQQFVTILPMSLSVASICLDTLYFLKPKPTTRKRKQSTT